MQQIINNNAENGAYIFILSGSVQDICELSKMHLEGMIRRFEIVG